MYDDPGDASIAFHLHGSETAGTSLTSWDTTDVKMTIRNSGNVGIGTASPLVKLQVVGANSAEGQFYVGNTDVTYSAGINFYTSSTNRGFVGWRHTNSGSPFSLTGIHLFNTDNSNIVFGTNSLVRAVIDTSGNVGIGFTAVTNKLQVAGEISTHAGANTSYYAYMNYLGTTYNFGSGENTDNVDFKVAGGTTWTTGGNFRFWTQTGASTPVERMRITPGGRVGIGTTSPSTLFQVSGAAVQTEGLLNISNTYASGGVYYPAAKIRNTRGDHSYGIVSEFSTGATGGDRATVLFYCDSSAHSWQIGQVTSAWGAADGFGIGYRANNAPSTFSNWPTNYFIITTAGDVGIGASSPGAKLDVRGKVNVVQGGRTLSLGDGNYANHILCDSNVDFAFNYNNNSIGGFGFFGGTSSCKFLCSNTGTLTVSGDMVAYGSPSDARLKTIKERIPNALDAVLKLNGYRFDWKERENQVYGDDNQILHIKEDIGVIAQEVAEVLPELSRTNDDGYMSVRYQGLTAVLIEAVKEQQAIIASLEQRINSLESK
jgi:hypothetical protein